MAGAGGGARSLAHPCGKRRRACRHARPCGSRRLAVSARRRHPCRPSRRHRACTRARSPTSSTPASMRRRWASWPTPRAAGSNGWYSCRRCGRRPACRPTARSPSRTRPPRPTPMAAPSSKASGWSRESGVPFTVLRPAVVYGKGVKGNIAALATLARTPMPLPFAGLDNRRSLLALDNLASAVALRARRRASGERDLPGRRSPSRSAWPISSRRCARAWAAPRIWSRFRSARSSGS